MPNYIALPIDALFGNITVDAQNWTDVCAAAELVIVPNGENLLVGVSSFSVQ